MTTYPKISFVSQWPLHLLCFWAETTICQDKFRLPSIFIKFHWTQLPPFIHVLSCYFPATPADVSSCGRHHMAHKAYSICSNPLQRKCINPLLYGFSTDTLFFCNGSVMVSKWVKKEIWKKISWPVCGHSVPHTNQEKLSQFGRLTSQNQIINVNTEQVMK